MMLTLLPVTALAEETAPKETEPQVVEEPAGQPETATEQSAADAAAPTATAVTNFEELKEAVNNGGDVQLKQDVVLTEALTVNCPVTLAGPGKIVGHIVNKSDLVLNHVTITSADGSAPTISNEDGSLNVDADSVVENTGDHYAIKSKGGTIISSGIILAAGGKSNHGISANGTNITINGGYVKGSDAGVSAGIALFNRNYANDGQGNAPSVCVVNGGKVQGCAYAIAGNNQKSGGDPGCSLTVNKGELVAHSAIYWPNNGAVVIGTKGGSDADVKITGTNGTGIEVICGSLTINSGTISGTASQTVTDDTLLANYAKSSGCGSCGDALTVVKNRAKAYAANPLSVTINGGTFLSANGNYSMRMFDCATKQPDNNLASGQSFDIAVAGGMFGNGIECSRSNETGFISDGTFSDLTSAVKYAAAGATIKLANDVTTATCPTVTKKLTLDLNGFTFSGSHTNGAILLNGAAADLTVMDSSKNSTGKIIGTASNAIWVYGGGKVTLNSGVLEAGSKKDSALYLSTNGKAEINGGKIVGLDYGLAAMGDTEVTINNGEITANGHALLGNGNKEDGSTFTINNGTIHGKESGIYHPQDGTLTVNGGTIIGDSTGIELRAGQAIINGGTITGNGVPTTTDSNGNGPTTAGAGIAVVQHTTKKATSLTVEGGTISGYTPVWEKNAEGNAADLAKVNIAVNGGNLKVINGGKNAVYSENKADFISGGIFTADPDDKYIAPAAAVATVTAADGTVKYVVGREDIQKAVTEAGPKAQVEVTKGDVALENVPQDTTVKNSGDGKVTADDRNVKPGSTITPNPKPSHSGGSSHSHSGDYLVNVDRSKNGTVSVSPKWADKGDTVTVTVKPDKGYELDKLIVTDKHGDEIRVKTKGNDKYTFTMPSGKVNVEAVFGEIKTQDLPFADVSRNAYYYDAVVWALKNGITSGVTPDTFQPYTSCTRAQTVTFLWRAAGCPAPVSTVNPFTDVMPGAYYYDAVLWAVEKGITKGATATTFQPNATVTRGQTVTFLYRCAGSPAAETATAFTDVASGSYCESAVQWAVENGITNGTTNVTFGPADVCTRGQIVTFLYRFAK